MSETTPAPDYTTDEGKAKLLAETTKINVEIEQLKAAVAKSKADEKRAKELHAVALESAQILRDRGKLGKEIDSIIRDRQRREEDMILACDWNHQVYSFSEPVDADTVQQCMTQINQWVRQYEAKQRETPTSEKLNVEITFDSPGGSLFDGMHLFDFIRITRAKGYDITTVALGNAASMAGILLQAGTNRVIGKESFILIHKVSEFKFMENSSSDELEDRLARLKKYDDRLLRIFAQRAAETLVQRDGETRTLDEIIAETTELIKSRWSKKGASGGDWWLDSDEAYQYGFVDSIR